MTNMEHESRVHDIRKSKVRVYVTYSMTAAYVIAALGLIAWLMWQQKTDLAMGIFSGVASTTSAITAFWFGSRGSARSQDGSPRRDDGAPKK